VVRCLVTGVAGLIGSHVCRGLVADSHDVVAIDDLSEGTSDNLSDPDVRLETVDMRDIDALYSAAHGYSSILHHATLKSVQRSVEAPPASTRSTSAAP
jgi:UDP-glucose 4-epimerase